MMATTQQAGGATRRATVQQPVLTAGRSAAAVAEYGGGSQASASGGRGSDRGVARCAWAACDMRLRQCVKCASSAPASRPGAVRAVASVAAY